MAPGRAIHLHAAPRARRQPVVECPAPPSDGPPGLGRAKGGGAVEGRGKRATLGEAVVDRLHHLAPEQVAAALTLVEDSRVVEERLDEIELRAHESAEAVHAVEDARQEPEPPPDLTGRQSVPERPHLFVDVAGEGAEERVAPFEITVDTEAGGARVGDLHERELR